MFYFPSRGLLWILDLSLFCYLAFQVHTFRIWKKNYLLLCNMWNEMEGGQDYGKSLWESKAVILHPLFQLIFLFALATWPFFPWTSFSCVSSRPSLIHTSILPAYYKRGTGSAPRIVCQCHKACPLCLLSIWPALAGCSEMPTLITNFTFKKRTQIMPGYLKSASCLLNSVTLQKLVRLLLSWLPVLAFTLSWEEPKQKQTTTDNLPCLELADSRK